MPYFKNKTLSLRTLIPCLLTLVISWIPVDSAWGQSGSWSLEELCQKPSMGIYFLGDSDRYRVENSNSRSQRPLLFGIPNGLGILDKENQGENQENPPDSEDDFPALQVSMGHYNPNMDMRLAGNVSQLGFFKMYSEMQVFDLGPTYFSLGLQAFLPAGQQSGGVNNGPTVFSPALLLFHDLGEGHALQGFMGQNINANSRWRENMENQFHYGLSYHYPLVGMGETDEQNLFFFVQALGHLRTEQEQGPLRPNQWQIIPGIYWRVNESCWLSFGASHWNMVTCSWQY